MVLFAQEADVLTAAAIIQILAQLGAIGLLGILVWQIPKIVDALKTWRRESELAHREERDLLRKERDEQLKAFREEIRFERQECGKNFQTLSDITMQNQHTTHQVLDKLADGVEGLKKAVEETQQ